MNGPPPPPFGAFPEARGELDLAEVRWCGGLSIVGGRRLMTPGVARAFALTSLLTTAAHAATTPWTRVGGSVRVSVDATSFAYSAALLDGSGSGFGCGGFADGGVAFRCRGVHYTHGTPQPGDATLVLSGAPREGSGADSLGEYDSIAADWQGGSSVACALHTEIRYYPATASFVFVADFSEDGVPGTNATAPLTTRGPVDDPGLSTAFPTWSTGTMGSECAYYSYQGNSLGGNWRAGPLSAWTGGLQAGPLLLYAANSTELHPAAMLISALTHAKAMIGSPGDKAVPSVSFGVQGYVEELPPSFTSAVILVGRAGISATQLAWGEAVRRNAGSLSLCLSLSLSVSLCLTLSQAPIG